MPNEEADGRAAKRRRKLFGAALLAAIGLFRAHAESLTTSLSHAEITADAWASAYVDLLVDLHAHAYFAGRGVASTLTGAGAPTMGLMDEAHGTAIAAGQASFVRGFREDIESGRYSGEDGEINPKALLPRIDLYANRAHGTAHEGLQNALGSDDEIYWRLGGNEDHCETCPKYAEGGPYTRFTLPAVPGDGTTDCGTNCLCHLEVNGIPVPMLARP